MFNNSKYGRFLFFSKFVATGATMAFKKSLADKTFPLPSNRFYIHDFWIIVMGSCFGKVSFINEPLILYRQHDQQLIGAKTAKPEILSGIYTQKKTDKLIDFLIDKRGKEIIVLDSFNKHHNSITEDEQAILEIRIRLMDSLINKPTSFFQRLKLIRFALYKYKIPEFYSLRLFIGNSFNYLFNR
jgi:hypothetical protein